MLDDTFFLTYESFLLLSNDVTILNKLCIEAETFAKAFFICLLIINLFSSVLSVGPSMRSKLKNISPV